MTAVTPFDVPWSKTPCSTQTSWLYICFAEPELLPIEVLHCGNRNFRPFCLLWPWPDDLHIRTWPVVQGGMPHFESYRLTDIQTDRQTRPKFYTAPLRGWSIKALFYSYTQYKCPVQTYNKGYLTPYNMQNHIYPFTVFLKTLQTPHQNLNYFYKHWHSWSTMNSTCYSITGDFVTKIQQQRNFTFTTRRAHDTSGHLS